MVLVNVRTSGTLTSGVANELDPRGGAAITGDNAVGKTTTMKLLALFFGTPPSQIEKQGSSRIPMLRFVLPEPSCAVVFEYQRGDEPQDVNCVVVRRQDGSDAPEYRLISGPFDRRYFEGRVEGSEAEAFLDDAGMKEAAEGLGALVETKLTSAQYRSVILNVRAKTADAVKLRRLAAQYSFAQRSLANLDRLIAAVVKEQISFKDFTAVAVAMAQAPQGQAGGLREEPERIALKQKKAQIDTWLRNRDSCAAAISMTPKVTQLRTELDAVVREEGLMAQRRADLGMLIDARGADVQAAKTEEARLKEDAERLLREEAEEQARLDKVTRETRAAHSEVEVSYQSARATWDRLLKGEAPDWADRVVMIPALREQEKALRSQVDAAAGEARTIEMRYAVMVSDMRASSAQQIQAWQASKQARQEALQVRLGEISQSEKDELEVGDQDSERRRLDEQAVLADLLKAEGQCEMAVKNPSVKPEVEELVLQAEREVDTASSGLRECEKKKSAAATAMREADAAFGRAELGVVGAREAIGRAEKALQEARANYSPADGTLLSALRSSNSQEWRGDLSKVLNPSLLHRKDLDARQIDADDSVNAGLVFGWTLELGGVSTPDWANDEALRARVLICEGDLERAREAEKSALSSRESAGKRRAAAEAAQAHADAEYAVIDQRYRAMVGALVRARDDRTKAVARAREEALSDLKSASSKVRAERERHSKAHAQYQEVRARVREIFKRRADDARLEYGNDVRVIEQAIASHQAEVERQVAAVTAQRDEAMAGQGVDVKRLTELEGQARTVTANLRELERHVGIAEEWRTWQDQGGSAKLENLMAMESVARTEYTRAKDAADSFLNTTTRNKGARNEAIEKAGGSIRSLEAEVDQLRKLVDLYPGTVGRVGSGMHKEAGYGDIKAELEKQARRVRGAEETISRLLRDIKGDLTRQDGAVKDLIEAELASLAPDASERARAHALCIAHRGVETQIVVPLNTELETVLENVAQFVKQIQVFESEIFQFNRRLQEGLRDVSRFERIREVELRVQTDFASLGIMEKLALLDEPYKEHKIRMQDSGRFNTVLPPETASQALRQVSLVLGAGSMEIELAQYVTLAGSVNENGNLRRFGRDSDLQDISSNGLSALIMITLLSGMVNVIRAGDPVYLPWCTDEIGKFDPANFSSLIKMLEDNRIDVVTASPTLTPMQARQFAKRYQFGERGRIGVYKPLGAVGEVATC